MEDLIPHNPATRVDLLGPPCVGKSTLCKAILGKSKHFKASSMSSKNWIDIEDANRISHENAYHTTIPKLSGTSRPRIFLRALHHGMKYYVYFGQQRPFVPSRQIEQLKKTLLRGFLEKHDAMFAALVECWIEPEMLNKPSFSNRFEELIEWTENFLFAVSLSENAKVLADNSRFTRGFAELLSRKSNKGQFDMDRHVGEYCYSTVAPTGIIHIVDEPGAILERIKKRENERRESHPGHKDKTEEELLLYTQKRLEVNSRAVDFFRSNGIKALTLDGSRPFEKNVLSAKQFLFNLEPR